MFDSPQHEPSLYWRLFQQARPYWRHLTALFLLSLLAPPLALLMPLPLKIAVDSVIGSHPLPAFLAAWLPPSLTQSPNAILLVAVLLLVVYVALGTMALKRERDPRNGFITPFRPNWRNSRDLWLKPAWLLDIMRHGLPGMENFHGYKFSSVKITDIASQVGREMDASFDWEELKRLRELWPGKLLLKGIERPDDAERAVAAGCDGVIVSNHGGRQLDGATPTLDALPGIASAVGSKTTVLLDGGVRRGVDIVKARALGAQAVLTGRATLFGVMAGGEPGARRALEILSDELQRAMKLCGVRSIAEIGPQLLFR